MNSIVPTIQNKIDLNNLEIIIAVTDRKINDLLKNFVHIIYCLYVFFSPNLPLIMIVMR